MHFKAGQTLLLDALALLTGLCSATASGDGGGVAGADSTSLFRRDSDQLLGRCPYVGVQNPPTGQCTGTGSESQVTESCNDETNYFVTGDRLTLAGNATFPEHGHVNFAWIPYENYGGEGSFTDQPSTWTVTQSGVHFDPINDGPGKKWIGQRVFYFANDTDLPLATGYCIIWTKVHGYNNQFGGNHAGPACVCPQNTAVAIPAASAGSILAGSSSVALVLGLTISFSLLL